MINLFNKKIYFKSYQIYFIGLFILICNFAFLFNEIYLEWAYYTCFQCINYDLLTHDFFKSIFYLHSQPLLWNFIIGLGYKFSSFFNNPLIFQGFLNFKNISHLSLNVQSTATIFFSVAFFLAQIQGLLIYRILTKFVNNLLSFFFLFIYFLSPFLAYQILLGSWEFYFSFFLIILIYFFYETNSTLKKTIFFRNILILTFSLIFLLLIRSTISIFFLIILIFLFLFKFDKKIVLKFIMLPVILVYFILCLKNFFIIKKFKL